MTINDRLWVDKNSLSLKDILLFKKYYHTSVVWKNSMPRTRYNHFSTR